MTTNTQLDWLYQHPAPLCEASRSQAKAHQATLTKPPGSLGQLETLAENFAAWQQRTLPQLAHVCVRVFAGDHGVCAQPVSAFPQSVTAQMIDNFNAGGAAINVLSRSANADFDLVNLGTVHPPQSLQAHQDKTIAPSTCDHSTTEAMTTNQLEKALHVGRESVLQTLATQKPDLFIGGEMGIGNTSSASLIYALLFNLPIATTTGPGTGLNREGVNQKAIILQRAYDRHQATVHASEHPALTCLRCVGGFEIAALTGAYITAAQQGIPVLVDGFITTAAWLAAVQLNPDLRHWSLFSHCSAEPAHQQVLQEMQAQPLLNLGMRLGEGSGAAMAVPIIANALKLHSQMATFQSAGVDDRTQ